MNEVGGGGVVYCDQRVDAIHPKRWSKSKFLSFLMTKGSKKFKKARNWQQNLTKKCLFFQSLYQNAG